MEKINLNILKTINIMIRSELSNIPFDKTFKSTVYAANNNIYTIIKDKQKYHVPNGTGAVIGIGQGVWVTIPCGKLNEMFISGIR